MSYDPRKIEPKWQRVWEERGIYSPDLKRAKKPFYNLMMFPYPSAEGLHVGNVYAFCGSDVYGRFMKMKGFDVFEPIGLDGFGIHSENYALKVNRHPLKQAKISEERFYGQLKKIGNIFDWKHTVETYDPDYYKWTQWVFVQMYKNGLAYRGKALVNWCSGCKTTLSDEQVVGGVCERCKTPVTQKELDQWFFKITNYAERLLKNLEVIDWSEKVKIAQRQWIGKSEGVNEYWHIEGTDLKLTTFTTWPHTTWGATFIAVAPQHPIIRELVAGTSYEREASDFCSEVVEENKKDPLAAIKVKKGFFTGRYAINHLTREKIKIFIANFAVVGYGTGVVKCCPAHDQKDFEFAKKFNLEIRPVIVPPGGKSLDPARMTEAYIGEGTMQNAGRFNGMPTGEARKAISELIVSSGNGEYKTNYHLRDWCVSRQRYWGAPIPMINCRKCGWLPVDEKDLPVLLPNVSDWRPKGEGRSPLANIPDFVHTKCPNCGGEAVRETDVCDTFLDSAWYFLRYPSTSLSLDFVLRQAQDFARDSLRSGQVPFDPEITKKWLPVEMYIGGAEHSVLHLMYSRFITMALHDLGYLDFSAKGGLPDEPFTRFFAHGLIIREGAKMSKSKGNIVNPDEYIERFGADTLRCYLMFLGPFSEGGDFRNFGVAGVYRFLNRVWRFVESQISNLKAQSYNSNLKSDEVWKRTQRLVKEVTEDLEKLRYNTAIAKMMEFLNYALKRECNVEIVKTYLLLLAPFAPHMTEELWQLTAYGLQHTAKSEFKSIHQESWPEYDEKAIVEEEVTIVIQINGKVRDKIIVNSEQSDNQSFVEESAKNNERVKKYLEGKGIKKVIFVPGRLINFVI